MTILTFLAAWLLIEVLERIIKAIFNNEYKSSNIIDDMGFLKS
jgi:hypothetical protein